MCTAMHCVTLATTTQLYSFLCVADTLLCAGVSVAASAIVTSVITAIVSSIIMYWCCVKRTSSVPAISAAATVEVQPNIYGDY